MPVNNQEVFVAQRNQIFAMLQAEQNYGGSPPTAGGGTNVAGRLQTVLTLSKSDYPDFNALPWVGVMFMSADEDKHANQRRHEVISHFKITIAARSQAEGDNFIQVEDALAQIETLLSDGNGNGVLPILRDKNNYTLPVAGVAQADYTIIRHYTTGWVKTEGKGSLYVGVAEILFDAHYYVQPITG